MGSYFKPLQRKVGVLTLGLVCVFMAVWVRSSVTPLDGLLGYDWLSSRDGNIECVIQAFVGEDDEAVLSELVLWRIPYWSIVIPLTLLSSYLVFSIPRQRRTPVEPVPETAA